MRTLFISFIVLACAALAACGTKTPLSKPPGPAKPPLLGPASAPVNVIPTAVPTTAVPTTAGHDNKPATEEARP